MIIAALAAVMYVVPYLYRRRRTLSDARIEERYAQGLRMIEPADELSARGFRDSYGTVFEHRIEGIMATRDVNDTATTVRALARDRARRRARIAQRETNRTHGFIGAGIAIGLAVVLWALRFYLLVPMWLPIVASVAAVLYIAGFAYLLREISAANVADLAAIEDLTSKLRAARGASDEIRRRRAAQAESRSGAGRTPASVKRLSSRATQSAPGAEEHSDSIEAALRDMPVGRRPPRSRPERERPRKAEVGAAAPVAAKPASGATAVAASSPAAAASLREQADFVAGKPGHSAALGGAQPVAGSVGPPSYTLKPGAIERRDIAPYEAPEVDISSVPYRPKAVGERFASPTEAVRSVNAPTVESAQPLAGGSALDDLLARRRA